MRKSNQQAWVPTELGVLATEEPVLRGPGVLGPADFHSAAKSRCARTWFHLLADLKLSLVHTNQRSARLKCPRAGRCSTHRTAKALGGNLCPRTGPWMPTGGHTLMAPAPP